MFIGLMDRSLWVFFAIDRAKYDRIMHQGSAMPGIAQRAFYRRTVKSTKHPLRYAGWKGSR